ncbi:MAG: DUF488 family protein [Lachnospiraceae bacterium]|jgi:uncharacterized protein YeaO (DUF488 family)|nr:DUF488 family protein [Lachnospiraceae bacterium]
MPEYCIRVKRVYEAPDPEDGCRILADRLWPRGLSREKAALDRWVRDVAPTEALRKSYAHKAERYEDFRTAYRKELDENPEAEEVLCFCRSALRSRNVTLLCAAKDENHSNAFVLCEWIKRKMEEKEDVLLSV